MKGRRIRMFSPLERSNHFLLLLSFFLLLLSGLPILSTKMSWLSGLFGGMTAARTWHHYSAFLFTAAILVILVPFFKSWTAPAFKYRPEDRTFLARFLPVFFNLKSYEEMPPQERFNGGQKVWALLTVVGGIIMVLTGFVLLYKGVLSEGLVLWSLALHSFGALGLTAGVIGHIYLSVLHPEARESWKAMFVDGAVNESYAASHHGAWLEEQSQRSKA